MSKKLTSDEKLQSMKIMCKSFSKEQVEHLECIKNVDARYKCAQRYLRDINEGKKGEQLKALEYYKRYREILEGLDCIDNKVWTNEGKIRAIINLLDGYGDRGVALIDENNRKHLERLKLQRDHRRKEYEAEQAKFDKEIALLEEKLR